jgi:hypothetical protein
VDRTINRPQALDMFRKKLRGPVSKHNCKKEHPAFNAWAPISRHRRIMAREAGRVRKIAPTAVPGLQCLAGRFCTPYEQLNFIGIRF